MGNTKCQKCQSQTATVHVTEIDEVEGQDEPQEHVRETHLCDQCAQAADLPHTPVVHKMAADIWKLLQMSAQQTRKRPSLSCPDCGMTLEEFHKKGRLGCPRDYEVFGAHIAELLDRVHGSRAHVGRVPGLSDTQLDHMQRVNDLQQRLEVAIREEAYENAARIRDELKSLQESTSE